MSRGLDCKKKKKKLEEKETLFVLRSFIFSRSLFPRMSTIPSQQRAWSLLAGLAVSAGVYVAAQVRHSEWKSVCSQVDAFGRRQWLFDDRFLRSRPSFLSTL